MKTMIIPLLCAWMLEVQANCPSECKCTATSISCVNQNLDSVPNLYSLDSSPLILDFSGNHLLSVDEEDFDFPKIEEVTEIYLNNSEIVDIGRGTFDNVENLQELYLGQNLLSTSSVPDSIVEHLDNMVLLDMSNNYFNGNMPSIRSNSLRVLALVNSKITNIPENALKHLPNLKLLLLQQNNIQTLSFEPFRIYTVNSFSVKLSFNSWTCNCDNLKAFELLGHMKFIEISEAYTCTNTYNEIENIFQTNGEINSIINKGHCDVDMDNNVQADSALNQETLKSDDDEKDLKSLKAQSSVKDYKRTNDIKESDDTDLELPLSRDCWNMFMDIYSSNGFLTVVFISTATSFLIGFATGIIFCRITQLFRYKNLEKSSESQVQLLRA